VSWQPPQARHCKCKICICFTITSHMQIEGMWWCACRVTRFYDMTPALDAACAGLCLTPRQLQGVANTIAAALQLRSKVCLTADPGVSVCSCMCVYVCVYVCVVCVVL